MKYLVKPRHIAKYFYSTSDDKRRRNIRQDDPEPFELLNDQEIEFEVRFRNRSKSIIKNLKNFLLG